MCKKTKHDCSECMCMYVSFVTVCLAVMCIFVIYKLGQQSAVRSGDKPSQEKIAKPTYQWEAAKRPIPWGE